jgi:hypothetical protein
MIRLGIFKTHLQLSFVSIDMALPIVHELRASGIYPDLKGHNNIDGGTGTDGDV